MEKCTFLELAKKVDEDERRPLSPWEIWQIAINKGYNKTVSTQAKTPWRTIEAQIYVSIRDKKDRSPDDKSLD